NHIIQVWDLRQIRQQLAAMGLDWDLPPYPPAAKTDAPGPLHARVLARPKVPPRKHELRRFEEYNAWVWSVAFSPDGRLPLAAGGEGGVVRLWDTDTGKEVRQLNGHTGRPECAVFSPDGRRILSSGCDHKTRLWDLETGKELRRFDGHTGAIRCVVFSPDGLR